MSPRSFWMEFFDFSLLFWGHGGEYSDVTFQIQWRQSRIRLLPLCFLYFFLFLAGDRWSVIRKEYSYSRLFKGYHQFPIPNQITEQPISELEASDRREQAWETTDRSFTFLFYLPWHPSIDPPMLLMWSMKRSRLTPLVSSTAHVLWGRWRPLGIPLTNAVLVLYCGCYWSIEDVALERKIDDYPLFELISLCPH